MNRLCLGNSVSFCNIYVYEAILNLITDCDLKAQPMSKVVALVCVYSYCLKFKYANC